MCRRIIFEWDWGGRNIQTSWFSFNFPLYKASFNNFYVNNQRNVWAMLYIKN